MESADVLALEGVDPAYVFKVRGDTRLTAGTMRGQGLQVLGEDANWQYFVLADREAIDRLLGTVEDYGDDRLTGRGSGALNDLFDLIDDIEPFGPEDRRSPNLDELSFEAPELVDVLIWPSDNDREARARIAQVQAVLSAFDPDLVPIARDDRAQSTVVRVRASAELLEQLLRVPVVERVRATMRPAVEPSVLFTDVTEIQAPSVSGALVGVIDDGVVSGHPLLSGLVTDQESFPRADQYVWRQPGSHGTAVVGLAVYGDLEPGLAETPPRMPTAAQAIVARVLEPDPRDPGRTRFADSVNEHVAFESAVRWLALERGVRVIVASIAEPRAFGEPLVNEFTETIDRLVRELNIVIVTSIGNFYGIGRGGDGLPNAVTDYPRYLLSDDARAAQPALASSALTVGSVARYNTAMSASGVSRPGARAIAEPGQPSPFSRSGPGTGPTRAGAIKPDVVDWGGNVVVPDSGGPLDYRNAGVGAVSLHHDFTRRLFSVVNGTSFAAPRVANLAAHVAARYPNASGNLIRAIVAVSASADAAAETLLDVDSRWRLIGNGRPDARIAVDSGPSRVALLHDGTIECDSIEIHRIPFPRDFLESTTRRRIRIALAFNPPVRRERREYMAGKMTFDLVHGMALVDVIDCFRAQPSWQARRDDPSLTRAKLPPASMRYGLTPGANRSLSSTLSVREITRTQMADEDYYVVVTHRREPWAGSKRFAYSNQDYAMAIMVNDEERHDIDLHALMRGELRARARVQR